MTSKFVSVWIYSTYLKCSGFTVFLACQGPPHDHWPTYGTEGSKFDIFIWARFWASGSLMTSFIVCPIDFDGEFWSYLAKGKNWNHSECLIIWYLGGKMFGFFFVLLLHKNCYIYFPMIFSKMVFGCKFKSFWKREKMSKNPFLVFFFYPCQKIPFPTSFVKALSQHAWCDKLVLFLQNMTKTIFFLVILVIDILATFRLCKGISRSFSEDDFWGP